jgi:hypothetical protein
MSRWWIGCGLSAVALALSVRSATAQVRPYTLTDVAEAVVAGLETRMLELARQNCLTFPVDSAAEQRLRTLGASASFTSSLRDVCYRGSALEVRTEPSGGQVRLHGRQIGQAPLAAPVTPEKSMVIEVSRGTGVPYRLSLTVPPEKVAVVSLRLPEDTQPVPPRLGESELRDRRAQLLRLRESGPRPTPPTPPRRTRSIGSIVVGGLIGAAVAGGAGSLVCKKDVPVFRVRPDGVREPAGTTSELTGGCLGLAAGAGAVGGGLVGHLLGQRSYSSQWRAYQRESQDFPNVLARFEERQQAAQRLDAELRLQADRDRIIAENARVRERNAKLGEPTVRIEDARQLPRAGVSGTP